MKDQTTKKILIEKDIFTLSSDYPILWEEIKHIQFEDKDKIQISYDEGHHSENNSYDPHWFAVVSRKVLETDTEFNQRMKYNEADAKRRKEMRFQNYLKLKSEFENDDQKENQKEKI